MSDFFVNVFCGLVEYLVTRPRFTFGDVVIYKNGSIATLAVINNVRFTRPEGWWWCWVYDITIVEVTASADSWIRTDGVYRITTVNEGSLATFNKGAVLGVAPPWARTTP